MGIEPIHLTVNFAVFRQVTAFGGGMFGCINQPDLNHVITCFFGA